ncbi:MAG: CsbD family protein [Alphaproteobacteria bacterium]|nr:CsbD family protein [Alphaproteobacteria bacterium]
MDKEHVKGAIDKTKGAVKDAVGGLTGDDKLQAEGKMDKAKGAAHNALGNVKDAVKDLSKKV